MGQITFFAILVAITCFFWALIERIQKNHMRSRLYHLELGLKEPKLESVWLSYKDDAGRHRSYHAFVTKNPDGRLVPAPEDKRILVPSMDYEGKNPAVIRAPYFEVLNDGNIMMLGATYTPA